MAGGGAAMIRLALTLTAALWASHITYQAMTDAVAVQIEVTR